MYEFEFKLSREIQYHDNGQACKAKKMLLRAPSMRQQKYASILKQGLQRADSEKQDNILKSGILNFDIEKIKQLQNESQKSTSKKVSGKDIIELVCGSKVLDLNEFFDSFKDLLKDGACLVEGKIIITDAIFEELDYNEGLRLMGEYLANFLA